MQGEPENRFSHSSIEHGYEVFWVFIFVYAHQAYHHTHDHFMSLHERLLLPTGSLISLARSAMRTESLVTCLFLSSLTRASVFRGLLPLSKSTGTCPSVPTFRTTVTAYQTQTVYITSPAACSISASSNTSSVPGLSTNSSLGTMTSLFRNLSSSRTSTSFM